MAELVKKVLAKDLKYSFPSETKVIINHFCMTSSKGFSESIHKGSSQYTPNWTYDVGIGVVNKTDHWIRVAFEIKRAGADEFSSKKKWVTRDLEPEEKTRVWSGVPTQSISFYKRVGISRIRIGPTPDPGDNVFKYDEEYEPKLSFYKALKLNTFLSKKSFYKIVGRVGLPLLLIFLVYSCMN